MGGKVYRAVENNRDRRIEDDVLVELTVLAVEQVHAGITWHNERARALRESRGE